MAKVVTHVEIVVDEAGTYDSQAVVHSILQKYEANHQVYTAGHEYVLSFKNINSNNAIIATHNVLQHILALYLKQNYLLERIRGVTIDNPQYAEVASVFMSEASKFIAKNEKQQPQLDYTQIDEGKEIAKEKHRMEKSNVFKSY